MKPITITLEEHHVNSIMMALEVLQRLHLGQFRIALAEAFKKKYLELGFDKFQELEAPLKGALFPEYPCNGGPGICGDTTQEAKVAFEVQKAIELCLALRKSGGFFGSGKEFDGNDLCPSGLPTPIIEEVKEEVVIPFPGEFQKRAVSILEQYDRDGYSTVDRSTELWNMAPRTRGRHNSIRLEKGIAVLVVVRPRKPTGDL